MYDLGIRDVTLYDGTGKSPQKTGLLVHEGIVKKIGDISDEMKNCKKLIDGQGCWLTPGFIDFHTHYDAEVEIAPALSESLRHGVTTVTLGSCSLSLVIGKNEDLADMFCRVEAIPREHVLKILRKNRKWKTVDDYVRHLNELPTGPNISSFLGHSAIRAHVMGLERSLDKAIKPTQNELEEMRRLLNDALDLGFLGMSINTLTWDKMDGERFRSRPLPSTFASWSEYRYLTKTLRKRAAFSRAYQTYLQNITYSFSWQAVLVF